MKTKNLKRKQKPKHGGSLKPDGSEPWLALDSFPAERHLRPTADLAWCNGVLVQFCTSDVVGDDGAWIKVPTIIPNAQHELPPTKTP